MNNSSENSEAEITRKISKALKSGKGSQIIDLNKSIDFKANIHFHKMEDLLNETNNQLPPLRLFHYVMAFFVSGSGIKTIGNYTFNIVSNLAIIVPRNVIHSTTGISEHISGFTLSFHEDLFNQINLPISFLELNKLFHYSRKPYIRTDEDNTQKIIALFKDIYTFKNSTAVFSDKMLGLRLIELVLMYHTFFDTIEEKVNNSDILFDQFVSLVEAHFREYRNTEWYADKIGVNSGHLNKIIQKHTGNSTKYFIQNRVIFEARYLLTATKVSVKEIAFDLGFQDYNYFCRLFKTVAGVTPGEFRHRQH